MDRAGRVQGSGFRVQGSRVLGALLLAVLATAVVPPAGAWWLNSRRIAATSARVVEAAAAVLPWVRGGVVCGPGRLPDTQPSGVTAAHTAWLAAAVVNQDALGPTRPTDAWGRCFLVNDHWLLSAGPNGVIDTPLDATTLGGDDVGVWR